MNVALAFPGCHRRGGVERIVYECAEYLASRDHEVHVYAHEWQPSRHPNIQYHFIPMHRHPNFLRGISFQRECNKQLRKYRHDALNTHGCVCPFNGVHWVQSVHRAWLERSKNMRRPISAVRLKQRLNPLHPALLRLEAMHFQERRYRKVIATTPEVKTDLHRFYRVPAEDVIVIPNGFSPSEFNPQRRQEARAQMRARLGLRSEQIALLFVANELERKGYRTILSALQKLNRADLRLLVVGRADGRAVMQIASDFRVANQVIACGATAQVADFHAASDIFVLPTQYEAFCLAILEALGSGLPVVTTQVPGARDAIQPGVNGLLISDPTSGAQLAAALELLLTDRNGRFDSDKIASSVQCYQWPVVLAQYEQVLLHNCC